MTVTLGEKARAIAWAGLSVCAIAMTLFAWRLRAESDIAPATVTPFAGYQYRLVFIARSSCTGCQNPSLPAAIGQLRYLVQQHASAVSQSAMSVAVVSDEDHELAFEFLEAFGQFDEVSLGSSWNNMMLRHFQERSDSVRFGTPAVYVTRRSVTTGVSGLAAFGEDSVLVRLMGVPEILNHAADLEAAMRGVVYISASVTDTAPAASVTVP